MTVLVEGSKIRYEIAITWMKDIEVMHIACAFDCKVPLRRQVELRSLIALINERLWVGHFDLWAVEGTVMLRSGQVLAGGATLSGKQCEMLIAQVLDICERYYDAFQFVVWGGKSAKEALEAAMFETKGEA